MSSRYGRDWREKDDDDGRNTDEVRRRRETCGWTRYRGGGDAREQAKTQKLLITGTGGRRSKRRAYHSNNTNALHSDRTETETVAAVVVVVADGFERGRRTAGDAHACKQRIGSRTRRGDMATTHTHAERRATDVAPSARRGRSDDGGAYSMARRDGKTTPRCCQRRAATTDVFTVLGRPLGTPQNLLPRAKWSAYCIFYPFGPRGSITTRDRWSYT